MYSTPAGAFISLYRITQRMYSTLAGACFGSLSVVYSTLAGASLSLWRISLGTEYRLLCSSHYRKLQVTARVYLQYMIHLQNCATYWPVPV